MTGALSPDLAVAYVRELSADVQAAVALDAAGALLAGPAALHGPARELSGLLGHGIVRTGEGLVVVARGPALTLVATAGRHALPGPHALDAAAAAGAATPPEVVDAPGRALYDAALNVMTAT